jgi:N-acetylmuramic acid 6-phosphate etherase
MRFGRLSIKTVRHQDRAMKTEDIDPDFADLDLWDTGEALQRLHAGQMAAVAAVGPALGALAAAVGAGAERLQRGGRLIYAGAGTSARIAVQDGAELLPTFGWPADRVVFVVAGGETALLRPVENAEDEGASAAARIGELQTGANDVVVAVAASGETPFTIAALEAGKAAGALTVGIASNAGTTLLNKADHAILLATGAEPVSGSTRMKAGTAQKVALNLFSTMLMVRMGRVYRGQMVDMIATNEKLRKRAVRMVASLDGCTEAEAARALSDAGDDLKVAVLVRRGLDAADARALLHRHGGLLRKAIAEL